MSSLALAARRKLWRAIAPDRVAELESRIAELSPKGPKSWYYHIDFGYGVTVRPELRRDPHSGEANWRFIAAHLPDLSGKRVLDIGCNAGLYALRMSEAGAGEVIGVELDTTQAEFVRQWLGDLRGRDYSNVRFVPADVRELDLQPLGRFDLVCLFCVLYHLADRAEDVMARVAASADTVALQGNLPRLDNPKYAGRTHQDLAGVPGMRALLERHGFADVDVVAPPGHPKPLVIGRRTGP